MDIKSEGINLPPLGKLFVTAFFTLAIIVSITFYGVLQVEQEIKSNLTQQLKATKNSTLATLKYWFKEKRLDAEVIASEPNIQKKTLRLVNLAKNKLTAKELITIPELSWLRKQLGTVSKKYDFVGFVIFNLKGRQVGALLDTPVGQNNLKDRSDFFQRSLMGETVVSLPFKGEVDLPDIHGTTRKNWPTMFVSTPVRDDTGVIQAILSFRIRPENEFSKLLFVEHFGKTGKTYTFSSKGIMLTETRFNQQLRQLGLIPPEPWSLSILNVHIKNPQGNMTKGFKPSLSKNSWPLTQMAASATFGGNEVEITPYNDYRGVPVVGAWSWLAEYNLGVTAEMDAHEALKPLYTLRKSFYSLFAFLSLTCALVIFFRSKQIFAEKKQHQKELKNLDEKLKTQIILDNVVDSIITIDEQGIIQTFNKGSQIIFQYNDSEVLGQNIKMLMPEPDQGRHDEYLRQYLTKKIPHVIGISREVTGLKKDGTEFPMELSLSQANLHDRVIFTGVIRDISLRKESELALIDAKKLAEKANKTKGDYLANMSHEIRTPMNGIIGLTHLALKTETNPDQYDYLKKIQQSSQNLLTIINDILDVSKIEAGKMNIEDIEFNLEKVLEGVSDVLSVKFQEKGLEFYFNFEENVPLRLRGDPVRLSQILINLTSNAAKFTSKGQIIISLRLLNKTEETLNLEFSVKDSGIGLSEDQIAKLFKPFMQADTTTTRNFGGTGLGLTIVKNLVSLMGGNIRIESQPGKGSNFIFNILFKPIQKKEEPLSSEPSSRDVRILVIDDSPFMRDILMAMLKTLKFEATATSRFTEGLEKLKTATKDRPYDLVIIDNNTPDAIGREVCSQIKNVNPEKDIKTILISGFSEDDILKDIETTDFDGFLHQPITRSTLLNMIQHIMDKQKVRKRIFSKPKEPKIENLDSIQGAQILLVEDNQINQHIGYRILQNAGLIVSIAENGQEALEAIKQNQFDTILMDIQMPVMDGYRATREIRALRQFKDLPIIAMTANATFEDRKKALECGMNDYITKPIDPTGLITTLVKTITSRSQLKATTPGPLLETSKKVESDPTLLLSQIPDLNIEDGLARVAYREDTYINLLIHFSHHTSDALELFETAVHNQEMKKAADLLHNLKGVAANLGAKNLADLAAQMEKKIKADKFDSECKSLLDSAKQSMSLLIAGIDQIEQKYFDNTIIDVSQPLPEYAKLSQYIEELENLILDNNIKAIDYLKTIEETFKETPIKDFLSPVQIHLSRFKFSLAADSLALLVNDLKTPSKETKSAK